MFELENYFNRNGKWKSRWEYKGRNKLEYIEKEREESFDRFVFEEYDEKREFLEF